MKGHGGRLGEAQNQKIGALYLASTLDAVLCASVAQGGQEDPALLQRLAQILFLALHLRVDNKQTKSPRLRAHLKRVWVLSNTRVGDR